MATQAFFVQGMCCSEEVSTLRQELSRRGGILAMDFDLLNSRMTVEYDSRGISPQGIIAAVAATGMKARVWQEDGQPEQVGVWERHGRLVMLCLSGLFLLAGFVSHWILHQDLFDALGAVRREGHIFPLLSILFYAASALLGAWYVLPRAVLAARKLRPDMNLLMTVAIIGAAAIGEWFESAAVAFLFSVALLLEQWSVERARRAIHSLLNIAPVTARVLDEHGHGQDVPVEAAPVGATILVRPGERLPLDGVVVRGQTSINQAPITGESMPAAKEEGDEVFAGTINEEGAIEIRTTRPAADTMLSRIIHMVEQAQSRRAHAQRWVDRFALYYTPAMLLLALGILLAPPLLLAGNWTHWFYQALVILVIACPCALVISTPVSIVSALTAAARNGVLIKGGVYLELAGKLQAVAMDKTGTLTAGHPEVQAIVPHDGHTEAELLAIAAALEAHSEHPLARAILRKARQANITPPPAEAYRIVKGRGAEARVAGADFWIGSHRMMDEKGQETPEVHNRAVALEDAGHTVVAIGNDQHVCGLLAVADSLRPNARQAVLAMKKAGMQEVLMLTGDNEGTARAIAAVAEVDAYHANLLPEDKVAAVTGLVSRHRCAAMIGDGINDAPAMAAASFGIAMAGMGADAAIETADVALMSDDLEKVPWLMRHSRRALGIVRQNIAFALAVKAVFITLAAGGLATLWLAIAADMGASMLVIFNALRLLGKSSQ